ncbi:MAG: hypothetical protein ACE5KG_01555 [Nitrososphaerales archaeon]
MVSCPTCATKVSSPVKTSSVLGDIRKDGTFSESTVGIYECQKCSMKFPHVFGRMKFEIIKSKDLHKLRNDLDKAVSLNTKLTDDNEKLGGENELVKREVELSLLESKAELLSGELVSLKKAMSIATEEIDKGSYRDSGLMI